VGGNGSAESDPSVSLSPGASSTLDVYLPARKKVRRAATGSTQNGNLIDFLFYLFV